MGYINNIQVDSTTHLIEPTLYAASSTSNSGAAYTASISDFSLVTGVTIQIKFSVTNKANATLSINNGDVKNIYYNNAKVTANLFKANHIYELTYDGTQWQVVGDINTDTWKALSTSQAGYVAQAPNDDTKFLRGDANWAVLPTASTTVAGITKVGASDGAAAYSHNHAASDIDSGTLDLARIPTITNAKLTNSSLTVGNKTISLGGTGTLDDIILTSTTLNGVSWDITDTGIYRTGGSSMSGDQHPGSSTGETTPYSYGELIVVRADGYGAAQFYISDYASNGNAANGIRYRSGWNVVNHARENGTSPWKPWATILDSHNYKLFSLPLSGGTLTGVLTLQSNLYSDSYSGALNLANSNIYGVNSIYTSDSADNAAEGIHFYRDTTHVDTLWMNGGDILFVPNRALGTSTTKANSQKVARFTTNPTDAQVVITNGTTGGIISQSLSDFTASLGLSNAMHFIGVVASDSTNTPSDGSNSIPTITGISSYTPAAGDVIIDKDNLREYVWSNGAWILLGFTTSSIYNSDSITASSSDEPTWISNIQQATDGKISVQRQTIGTLGVGHGGTGKSEWTQWGIVYASATNALAQVTAGASNNINQPLISGGAAAPTWYAGLSLTGAGTQQSPYNANFSNTVTITGASTLSSTLSVASTSTLTGNVTIGDNSHASTLTVFGATTLKNTASIIGNTTIGNASTASTLDVYGATTLNDTLSVTSTSTLTGKVGIGAAPDNTYQLYVEGNSQFKGNIIPQATNTYYLGSNGNSPLRWKGLYIGTADSYGDAYTPIYWNNGIPDTVSPVQYFTWTIGSGKSGVTLTNSNIFTTNTYNVILVVTSGETNLNAPLVWSSADGTFSIQSKSGNTAVATSGAVSGYAIVARGTDITNSLSSTDIT